MIELQLIGGSFALAFLFVGAAYTSTIYGRNYFKELFDWCVMGVAFTSPLWLLLVFAKVVAKVVIFIGERV